MSRKHLPPDSTFVTQQDVSVLRGYADDADRALADLDYYRGGLMDAIDPEWARSLAERLDRFLRTNPQ